MQKLLEFLDGKGELQLDSVEGAFASKDKADGPSTKRARVEGGLRPHTHLDMYAWEEVTCNHRMEIIAIGWVGRGMTQACASCWWWWVVICEYPDAFGVELHGGCTACACLGSVTLLRPY